LFSAEILIGGILPLVLLSFEKFRRRRDVLLTCAVLVVGGVISQRMSLSFFTMWRPANSEYTPSLLEWLIAFAIPAAAALVYLFFTENLAVMEKEIPSRDHDPLASPRFDPLTQTFQEQNLIGVFSRRAGFAVFVIALVFALSPPQPALGSRLSSSPVQPARGWETLSIDGNSSGYKVHFLHVAHQQRLSERLSSEQATCQTCHHLNCPEDQATACWECHRDFQQASSIFDHTQHQLALGGNASCLECHAGEHSRHEVAPCQECHDQMMPLAGQVNFNSMALPYLEAMHDRCRACHEQEALLQNRPELVLCGACHTNQKDTALQSFLINP
jgi:hypothetical protein